MESRISFSGAVMVFGAAFLLVLMAYWPIQGFYFELEDWGVFERLVTRRPGGANFWSSEWENYFRPIEWIFYHVNFALFGFDAKPYYLVSMVHHALNAMLVYVFARSLRGSNLLGWLAAAFFAVYPTVWEAVSWIVAAGHQIVVTNMLLTFIFAAHYFQRRVVSAYVGLLIFFCLSLCTREQSIMALPTVALIHLYFLRAPIQWSRELRPYIPVLPVFLIYVYFQYALQQQNRLVTEGAFGFGIQSLVNWINIYVNVFIPNHIIKALITSEMIEIAKANRLLLSIAIVGVILSLLVALIYSGRTRAGTRRILSSRLTWFAAVFVALHLLVYSMFVGGSSAASRYTYIASIGASLLLAVCFSTFLATAGKRWVAGLVVVGLAISIINVRLGVETYRLRTNAVEDALQAFSRVNGDTKGNAAYHFVNPPYVGYAWERAVSVRFSIPKERITTDAEVYDKLATIVLWFDENAREFRRCAPATGVANYGCS